MKWAYFGHTPNMPINDEHFSYICRHGILTCNAFLLEKLIEAQVSPFFLLVDESTNEKLEQHLVMYACL